MDPMFQEVQLADVYREVRFWVRLIERGVETLESCYAQIAVSPRQAALLKSAGLGSQRAVAFREQVAAGLQQWSVTGICPLVDTAEKEEERR